MAAKVSDPSKAAGGIRLRRAAAAGRARTGRLLRRIDARISGLEKAGDPPADVEAVVASINATAQIARSQLGVMLFACLILANIVVVTGDVDLFVNSAIEIPQTGIRISTVDAYVYGPIILVFLHVGLTVAIRTLARQLAYLQSHTDDGEALLVKLLPFPILLGIADKNRAMTRLLAWTTTSVLPFLILLGLTVSFLRYQDAAITALHKALLWVDLCVVALLLHSVWPPMVVGRQSGWQRAYLAGVNTLSQAGRLLALAVVLAVTFYGTRPAIDDNPQAVRWRQGEAFVNSLRQRFDPVAAAGGVWDGDNLFDLTLCKWWRFGCRYLDLRGLTVSDDGTRYIRRPCLTMFRRPAPNAAHRDELVLRGRSLRFADFSCVDLDNIRLYDVDLNNSIFYYSMLRNADIDLAVFRKARLQEVDLSGSSVIHSEFVGTDIRQTSFRDTLMVQVDFYAAILSDVEFSGSWLDGVRLAGIDGANLGFEEVTADSFSLSFGNVSQVTMRGAIVVGDVSSARLELVDVEDSALFIRKERDSRAGPDRVSVVRYVTELLGRQSGFYQEHPLNDSLRDHVAYMFEQLRTEPAIALTGRTEFPGVLFLDRPHAEGVRGYLAMVTRDPERARRIRIERLKKAVCDRTAKLDQLHLKPSLYRSDFGYIARQHKDLGRYFDVIFEVEKRPVLPEKITRWLKECPPAEALPRTNRGTEFWRRPTQNPAYLD